MITKNKTVCCWIGLLCIASGCTQTDNTATLTGSPVVDKKIESSPNGLVDAEIVLTSAQTPVVGVSKDDDVAATPPDASLSPPKRDASFTQEATRVGSSGDTRSRAPVEVSEDAAPINGSEKAESMRVRPRLAIRSGGLLDLTFDNLEFKIEKDADFKREMLSQDIEDYNDKEVIIRGFILDASVFQLKNIKQFVLVRDNQECCFGPGAYIFHNIQVEMDEGKTTDFSIRPVTVKGKLSIKPWFGPDGKCYSVYHLAAKEAK